MTDWIPAMPNDLLIDAQGLTIRSHDALLVDNISFTLGRERVALVGESGSGKP
ncbi:ABC transporter ATP-binding protein [Plautia stali symbiont]|nr:ABC transporter ATP-binding protein [Plautia stali symbiont]